MFRSGAALIVFGSLLPLAAAADSSVVPAKTEIRLHVDAPLSSDKSHSGDRFGFTLADPIVIDGQTIAERNAKGEGTLLLAGHAGNGGHEGDLTLRFDGVRTADGRWLEFDDQRIEINGRNRKALSFVTGFIPFAGYGSTFIRGSEVRITPDQLLRTQLIKSAAVIAEPPASPAPTGSPQAR